jgi:hypothetical protein
MGKALLGILCLFFPFIAVLIRHRPSLKVPWTLQKPSGSVTPSGPGLGGSYANRLLSCGFPELLAPLSVTVANC